MRSFLSFIQSMLFMVLSITQVHAHALEPGYLEITEVATDTYRIFWRKPDVDGLPMAIDPALHEACDKPFAPTSQSDGRAWVGRWVAHCPGGLTGQYIEIEGLESTNTDVLVQFQRLGADAVSSRLTPDRVGFVLPQQRSVPQVLLDYIHLGVSHILEGFDHLLFVFALLLLVVDRWRLIGAVTAFTVAHSITLVAATMEFLVLPSPPVEAIIALSVMFLAVEIAKSKEGSLRLSERRPWVVSFCFGLLHGLGFAGALLGIGLPQENLPLALLGFNIGVEIGQLVFVGAVLLVATGFRRMTSRTSQMQLVWRSKGNLIASYAIGTISTFWFLDRFLSFAL